MGCDSRGMSSRTPGPVGPGARGLLHHDRNAGSTSVEPGRGVEPLDAGTVSPLVSLEPEPGDDQSPSSTIRR